MNKDRSASSPVNLGWPQLLAFQALSLGAWLIPVSFWGILICAALTSGEISPWLSSFALFARVLASASVLSCISLLLCGVRHVHSHVRRSPYSRLVSLLRGALLAVPSHLLHVIFGYAVAIAVLGVIRLSPREQVFVANSPAAYAESSSSLAAWGGAASCLVFSLTFFSADRSQIVFPKIQQRRFLHVRKALLRSILRSAIISCVGVFFMITAFQATASDEEDYCADGGMIARTLLVAWLTVFIVDAGAEMYVVFMTEHKRLSMCTRGEIGDEEEATILAACMEMCDAGSLEEALLSFPMRIGMSRNAIVKFRETSAVGNLLSFAKAHEMRSRNPALQVSLNDADSQLRQWWVDTCEAVSFSSQPSEAWEQFATLRKRRFNTVLQSIYTADAARLGYPFWNRLPLKPSKEIIRARAFFDLATLSEFDEDRRRVLYNSPETCLRTIESCMAVVDAVTLVLTVASRYAALEPTLPSSQTGQPLRDVFVLGPAPSETQGLDPKIKRDLAWKAELASRRLRRQPWLSLDWWISSIQSQFQEHDPVATQFSLGQGIVDSLDAVSSGLRNDGVNGEALGSSERAHHLYQHAQGSHRWLLTLKSQFCRTPEQQTEAILGDDQVVRAAVVALGNLAMHSRKEDQSGYVARAIPAILECLIECEQALDAYCDSPAFFGKVMTGQFKKNMRIARSQVVELRFCIERSVFAIRKAFHKRLPHSM